MFKHENVQIIKNKGQPEWAVIPYKDYLRLRELDDLATDVKQFKKDLANNTEELLPNAYAKRIIQGENPIRVWREYRGLSQTKLASKVKISIPFLSQLENDTRKASTQTLKKIANALGLSLDDLV